MDEKFNFAKCFEHQSPSRFPFPVVSNPGIRCGPSLHELEERIKALEKAVRELRDQGVDRHPIADTV